MNRDPAQSPVIVSDIVDPSAPCTAPDLDVQCPRTSQELGIALVKLAEKVPDEAVPAIYSDVAERISIMLKEREDRMSQSERVVEASVRRVVRKMLAEMNVVNEVDAEKMHNLGQVDAGEGLKRIADELGIGASHAKGVVTRALHKAQFMKNLYEKDPEGTGEMILNAVYDYIQDLHDMDRMPDEPEGEELTKDDIKLLADNPEMVAELPSFRVYLQKYIKRKGYKSPYAKD